ncbi:MAG: cation:proton antiporter [Thiogranum sp.]|jgi:Kef-type K+ transport system membrane component KefB
MPELVKRVVLLLTLVALAIGTASALAAGAVSHGDPIAPVILGVTGLLFVALIGRFSARKLGLPSVLGELTIGMIVGNMAYYADFDLIFVLREGPHVFDTLQQFLHQANEINAQCVQLMNTSDRRILDLLGGPHGTDLLQISHTVDVFSRYGIIFLLFMVGLETNIDEMRRVGGDSVRVALIGVIVPFVLGVAASYSLSAQVDLHTALFLGAALGATSIGITVSVLGELRLSQSPTAHIILGAAVFDDILGLLMLAAVSGIVVTGGIELGQISKVVLLAALFLGGAIYLSPYFLRAIIKMMRHLDMVEAKMFVSYMFVMVLAWLANLSGLATIIGAFTAGVILHDAYFKYWGDDEGRRVSIRDLIMPLEVILVPIFFVLMGLQVKLEAFLDWQVVGLATGLLIAAVVGKLVSGLGAKKSAGRLAIGFGMLPRGEVGLIFAAIGKELGVVNDALFSSLVLVVVITSLLAPPLLKLSLRQHPAET